MRIDWRCAGQESSGDQVDLCRDPSESYRNGQIKGRVSHVDLAFNCRRVDAN